MRPALLIAALALASCGSGDIANNAAVTDASGGDQVTAVNDVTAIDAATGEAADMAADVNYTFNEPGTNEAAGNAAGNAAANATANNGL